ncbi:MAG TPA: DUF2884 family protein [Xanthomonadaceae bacterium]|jgi:hypothetical protein|nr:DUF2884 family protein [Xanthomonadaceae bacterium]
MKSILKVCVAIAIAATLAACNGETYIGDVNSGHHLVLNNGVLTAHVSGQPDAVIDASGDLSIGGKSVALTPVQHDLLKTYYEQVLDIRKAGIETGKAGAAMAGHAVGAVVSGLAHGDPDSIGSRIDDRAKDVEAKALMICDNLEALQKTQDAVAIALPAFKPYATLEVRETSDCRSHAKHD